MMTGFCCCEECETLFTDAFNRADNTDLGANWEETVVGWAIASQNAESRTAGATILTVQDDFPPRFIGWIEFNMSAESPGANDYFCKFRYIFGWEDANSYWVVELDGKRTDSLFGDSYRANISIYRVVEGLESQFGATIEAIVGTPETAANVQLWVCASDELVHWELRAGGAWHNYSYPLPAALPDESRHGLQIVTCDADTELRVLTFAVSRHVEKGHEPANMNAHEPDGGATDGQCECPKYCPACQDSIFPDQWRVIIAGLVDVAPNHYSQCNGTYLFPGKRCDGQMEINCALRDGGHPTLGEIALIRFTINDQTAPFTALVELYDRASIPIIRWALEFPVHPFDCLTVSHTLERINGSFGTENSTAVIENAAL